MRGLEIQRMAKKKLSSIAKYEKRLVRKKRMAFMSNISSLAAMKLTENGSPTLPNTGYAEIARRIRAIRPDLRGGVQEVMANFVGQGIEAKALQQKVAAQKRTKVETRSGWSAYKAFYETEEWRRVRYEALRLHGGKCCLCGATAHQGAVLHVDHIKPRSLFRELELDVNNLQVLCADCNLGKSNLDDTDWRDPSISEEREQRRQLSKSRRATFVAQQSQPTRVSYLDRLKEKIKQGDQERAAERSKQVSEAVKTLCAEIEADIAKSFKNADNTQGNHCDVRPVL